MNSTIIQRAPRVFGAAALFGALLIAPISANAATVTETEPVITGQGCAGEEGVTIVVDFSDLGGDVVVGCAEGSPANGREVLEFAGFTPEDSMPGMVCTINSQPDPCPEEFDGNFWAYWLTDEDGAWEMSMVGLDEAVPEVGSVEAWRYNDASAGPSIEPAAAIAFTGADSGDNTQEPEATEEPAPEDLPSEEAPSEDAPATDDAGTPGASENAADSGGFPTWAGILIGLGIIGAIAAMIARRAKA